MAKSKAKTEIPSIVQKNGDSEIRFTIESIENGFVVTRNENKKDKKGNYVYESKKYFTEINPIAESADNMYKIIEAALGTENL